MHVFHLGLKFRSAYFAVFIGLFCNSQAFAIQDSVVIKAENLIRNGDFKAAYQLLEPLESSRAGDIDYDYVFGVAAVESKQATRGAFALERVLAQNPDHKDARAEMAKAHYMLGELEASKSEFNIVLQQNIDVKTKISIEKLLTAIDKTEGNTTTFNAYLDAGLGHDSNVNSAPNVGFVTIAAGVPNFGGLTVPLNKNAQEQSDEFANVAAGFSVRHPFTKTLAAFGTISGAKRINNSQTNFNTSAVDINAGLQLRLDKNVLTFALQDNHFELDSEKFRRAYGASAQWLHNIDAQNQAGLYAQYSRLDYEDNSSRNADRSIIGFNFGHVFSGNLAPVLFGSVYTGMEDALERQSNFLNQDIFGVRTGGQINLSNQWQLFTLLGAELRNNESNDPAFLKKRKDTQYDATIGARFFPAHNWLIKPQLSYTKNDSNIEINEYKRTVMSVNVRKDFNW